MGLLDTFTFMLKADSKNAVGNIEDVGEAFDDAKKKGVKAADDIGDSAKNMGAKLSGIAESIRAKFGEGLKGSFATLGASLGIAAVAGIGLNGVLERMPELVNKVKDAASVGVDVTSYDAMSRVFQQNGVDADGFRDSVIDLNEAMGEAASDAKSQKAQSFKTFGISLKDAAGHAKSADTVLMELSASMEKMNKQEATFQIKQLGITDNKVIQTLLLGNKALKEQIELQKQKFALTEKDQVQLLELSHAQNMLSATIDGLVDQFAVMLAPALTKVSDGVRVLIDWFLEHKRVIGIAAGVIATLLLPTIWSVVAATTVWAATTLIAIAPFLAIGAAVAALILVIDDLFAYYQGGGSIIGDFAAKHEMLKDVLDGLKIMALGLMKFFSDMWNDPEKALTDFRGFMSTVWENMVADTKAIFTELWTWIINLFKNIGGAISDGISNAAKDAYDSLPDWAKTGLKAAGFAPEEPKPATASPGGADMAVPGDSTATQQHPAEKRQEQQKNTPKQVGDMAPEHPLAQATVPAIAASTTVGAAAAMPQIPSNAGRTTTVHNTTSVQTGDINVKSDSADPRKVADAVPAALNDHLKSTAQHFDDGESH